MSAIARVYVGRLPPRCSERDIERFFKGYGRLRDIVLKNGYGFVEFDNEKDADDAVYDLHGRDLRGERIIVEHARLPPGNRGGSRRTGRDRYGPPTRTEYRAIVENLSSRVSWQDLKDMMRKAGEVTYADAHKAVRNEGHALERFNGYELYGRRLKVYEDRPRRRSSVSRSRSRSRRSSRRSLSRRSSSRSRSRSSRRSRSYSRAERPRRSKSSQKSEASHRDSSRSKSRSKSRSISRSKSVSHHSRDRSASEVSIHSKEHKSRSPSDNNERDKSETKEKSSQSRSRSLSRHRSRSQSLDRSRSRSFSGHRSRSRSLDQSRSRSQSRSHSVSSN